jgi:fructosamine-3-kinase
VSESNGLEQEITKHQGYVDPFYRWHPVGGGDTHECFRLSVDAEQETPWYFVKRNTSTRTALLLSEYQSLRHLSKHPELSYPTPILLFEDAEFTYLVMEYREQQRLSSHTMGEMGELLARQHQQKYDRFGWYEDNFIGSTPQHNAWSDEWVVFYREQRLQVQLDLARHHGMSISVVQRGMDVCKTLAGLFLGYSPAASLLHGDLWAGNAAESSLDGSPLLFDPAPYYGDRESDLAMTELFGGFSTDFYLAYDRYYPIDEGYEKRKPLYQLYHSLNHFNLFGSSYLSMVEAHLSVIERLSAV